MTYLGLQIPSEIIKTRELNYTPLLKKVGEELDRWQDLPISGRVNCGKINILPKFVYLFQTFPFPILNFFFKQLRKVFSFLCKGNPPKVKHNFFANHTQKEGLLYQTSSCMLGISVKGCVGMTRYNNMFTLFEADGRRVSFPCFIGIYTLY